jgi:wyosine [tRNA(Phe)-imidazoG37] synthetase (radical SAM superfamily)
MTAEKPSYIYGPVYSWRLGYSLGIDPVSDRHKICNYDCPYCQLGRTAEYVNERREFVPVETILAEIDRIPEGTRVDYYTFSGRGEPTLALNLGAMIRALKHRESGRKIAVITNSSLLDRKAVRDDLLAADYVSAKLDAGSDRGFRAADRPAGGLEFGAIIEGIKEFRAVYRGRLALQVMFTAVNVEEAAAIAAIAREIMADEVQLNTPLRACAVEPLSEARMVQVKEIFAGLPAVSVYERELKAAAAESDPATIQRHGRRRKAGRFIEDISGIKGI